ICAPSRASLLTGRYSTRFGFEFTPLPDGMARITSGLAQQSDRLHEVHVDLDLASTMPPFADLGMPPSEITIAEVLKDRGYHTLHLGKWHLGRRAEFRPTAQGFDESLFMESGLYLPEDDPNVVNAKQDFDPIDQFLWAFMRNAVSFNDGASFQTDGYLTDYLTDQAVASIEANKHRPFFMFLAHWGVHTPLQAAKADYDALSHIADHRLRVYAAMVRSVDRSVGRVMQALRDNGLDDNTLVILTSDNGGADYIGLPDINKPYRGWKLTLFEGGTHVPFFMRWPAGIPAGRHYDGVVSHIDLLPTIAAAAGADLPDDRLIDGVNLLPFATGQASGEPHKAVFWRQGYYQAVLSGGWKLQVSDKPNIDRLYHLAVDPLEQVNVAGQNPQKVTDLKALLATHNAGQSAPAWPSVIARPVSIDKTMADPEAPDDEYIYWPN
ncbi:MAG: sulfatase, partial [Alphaproteobacteria bacterium]